MNNLVLEHASSPASPNPTPEPLLGHIVHLPRSPVRVDEHRHRVLHREEHGEAERHEGRNGEQQGQVQPKVLQTRHLVGQLVQPASRSTLPPQTEAGQEQRFGS